MLSRAFITSLLLLIGLTDSTVYASPKFKLVSSTASAEKGHIFEIHITVETDELLEAIIISPVTPANFTVTPIPTPGISIVRPNSDGSVTISSLSKGSSLTIPFRVVPPAQFRFPFFGKGDESLDTTRDLKVFNFNISYIRQSDSGAVTVHQTENISVRYTTSLLVYLLLGIVGVLMGFIVKTVTQDKDLITELLKGHELSKGKKKFFGSTRILFGHIFRTRLSLLLTALVIGFGVLLALAQEKIPANGWFHAVALGIGISILSDEKLITKLPKPGG